MVVDEMIPKRSGISLPTVAALAVDVREPSHDFRRQAERPYRLCRLRLCWRNRAWHDLEAGKTDLPFAVLGASVIALPWVAPKAIEAVALAKADRLEVRAGARRSANKQFGNYDAKSRSQK